MRQGFDLIVIGGGATGAGVARDAAMRGFKTLLVEQGDLGIGTSGKYHGLLHSGGRYVVSDPQAAKECFEENLILKKIAKSAIENTGGFFVLTAQDDTSYADKFLSSCKATGIPVDEVSITKALQQEPLLNPDISRVFSVPDACCDSQQLIRMNIQSAHEYGAQTLTHHAVIGFKMSQNKIVAVHLLDKKTRLKKIAECQFVINASGIWAGKIAQMANLQLPIVANKGSMVVMKKRLAKRVLNRCRLPDDGDILAHTKETSIIGTTSSTIGDFTNPVPQVWEEKLLIEEGEKMIKDFASYGILSSYAGVRPLFKNDSDILDGRNMTRTHLLVNHKTRDNLDNLISILGGKLTTYRKMAEDAVNEMCLNIDKQRVCKTAEEVLTNTVSKSSEQ